MQRAIDPLGGRPIRTHPVSAAASGGMVGSHFNSHLFGLTQGWVYVVP